MEQNIPTLIQDLAMILAVAGVVSLLFKRLKQPLVLGYIVAGFIAGPHFGYTPSVQDVHSIDVWAQIGVIVLLFTLGLEFSFKKIIKMGGAPVIAALTIIFCMIFLGSAVGHLFGWGRMNCIYLGGMLAMSSTTIIYKAFQDMGLLQKRFAGLVLSVLILEDILAIVLMVLLSTLAVSNNIESSEMVYAILHLLFFLVLWFVVGLYFLPNLLRSFKKYLNEETLLILSLALCFGMAVVAVYSGFSAAFGSFVVGSILAETIEAERIERLVSPIKDLFGAIFFVSVGMLVDPDVLVEYAGPILAITCTIIVGQAIFGTFGFILAGQPLKEAMKCGFSMSQIGEFAFIIASLGMTLKVTSDFLYPVVVAVSVITTFTTPYMLRLAEPAYGVVCRIVPHAWIATLDRMTSGGFTVGVGHPGHWKELITTMVRQIVVFSILCITLITLSFRFFLPFLRGIVPHWWANALCGVITLVCLSPFLRSIMARGRRSKVFRQLWKENRVNRLPLIFTLIVRGTVVCAFVFYIIRFLVPFADALLLLFAMLFVIAILFSRRLRLNSMHLEKNFMNNLRSREIQAQQEGRMKPRYAEGLLTRDIHLADLEIPVDSKWCGKMLTDLNLGHYYHINIASIIRGARHINIPSGNDQLFPGDKIQIIGTDSQIDAFASALKQTCVPADNSKTGIDQEMILRQFVVEGNSEFVGEKLKDSGIRNRYHCMIVGYETPDGVLEKPDAERVFCEGDILWVVGERSALRELMSR